MKSLTRQTKRRARRNARFGVRLAVLYGSRATGTTRKDSDVDIAVLSSRTLTLAQQHRLQAAFARTLGISHDTIDLVDLRTAPPLLAYYIARDGKTIVGSEQAADQFYRHAMKRFIDGKRLRAATETYVKSYGR